MDDSELVQSACRFDKRALGKLVTALEDERLAGRERRRALTDVLVSRPSAPMIGVTGAPGVGKSTLIAGLCRRLLADSSERRIVVIAVDPSSEISGGSVLGDRTRLQIADEDGSGRLFFRSQASALELGGLAPTTYAVATALRHLADLVIIETVGVGQSELDVCHLADLSLVLVGPESGDQIQFMKAGLMEMPDVVVATKIDTGDRALVARLRASMRGPEVMAVSARRGDGMDALAARVAATAAAGPERERERDERFFRRWVARRYGASGVEALETLGPPTGDRADWEERFSAAYRSWLAAQG